VDEARASRATAASRLRAVVIPGPAGSLEGLLHEHEGPAAALAAVICHPHPLHGGSLHNKVVHRVATTLHDLGAAVLRFNFRGVGASEGRYDEGAGELADARAAVAWMRERHPGARLWLGGFSFGAWIAARLAAEPGIERLILVAPPIGTHDLSGLRDLTVPKLIIQGTADELCPLAMLERAYPEWAEPKTLKRVAGASHFFDRQLGALAEALRSELAPLAGGGAA
jgi:alpha/beta superfamily hydrolase